MTLRDRIQRCKDEVDFKTLVAETHVVKGRKILCPFHGDRNPSCVIYDDGFFCFACGAQGDHLDWLEYLGFTREESRAELDRRANGLSAVLAPEAPKPRATSQTWRPIPDTALTYLERRQHALQAVPASLSGHGFSLDELCRLGVAARGEDAILPINGPSGEVLNLKARLSGTRQGGHRYTYMLRGYGNPAWCAPGFGKSSLVVAVEGELNAAQWHLAFDLLGVQADVVGTAGANGPLYPDLFTGKDLLLYADPDRAGDAAKEAWRAQAIAEGARSVTALPPLLGGDACDVVQRCGRAALARWTVQFL